MSLKQLQDQYNDLSEKVDGIRTINQLPTKIAPDGTEYTPISEPDGSGGFIESKMPVGALHGAKWKEISDDYTLTLADRNSNIAVIVTAKTITLPNDLGWQNGDKCYIYQRVLNLTLDHSAVTTEIPQTLEDVQYCIYQITKEGRASDTDIYNITQVGVTTEEANTIDSVTAGEPSGSDVVVNVVSLTQAEYDAGSPNATTFYIITDA